MKYKEALKAILMNPRIIFNDTPNWPYVMYNFLQGIRWVWRAVWHVLCYPISVAFRALIYLTAPLSAFLVVWMVNKDREAVEALHRKTTDDYLRNVQVRERGKDV